MKSAKKKNKKASQFEKTKGTEPDRAGVMTEHTANLKRIQ